MQEFEKRKVAGEEIKTLEFAEVVTTKGKKQFRYMKAIPTGKVCLQCHGSHIDLNVAATLKNFLSPRPGNRIQARRHSGRVYHYSAHVTTFGWRSGTDRYQITRI